jgi:hypothetical protein
MQALFVQTKEDSYHIIQFLGTTPFERGLTGNLLLKVSRHEHGGTNVNKGFGIDVQPLFVPLCHWFKVSDIESALRAKVAASSSITWVQM